MVDELKHECAVALVVLKKDGEHYRNKYGSSDYGGTKLSLLLEKQHNRGQDGAGAAILSSHPESGYMPNDSYIQQIQGMQLINRRYTCHHTCTVRRTQSFAYMDTCWLQSFLFQHFCTRTPCALVMHFAFAYHT